MDSNKTCFLWKNIKAFTERVLNFLFSFSVWVSTKWWIWHVMWQSALNNKRQRLWNIAFHYELQRLDVVVTQAGLWFFCGLSCRVASISAECLNETLCGAWRTSPSFYPPFGLLFLSKLSKERTWCGFFLLSGVPGILLSSARLSG